MSFKRFFQLFVFYALSILISLFMVSLVKVTNFWGQFILLTIIGYVVLGAPLTILTLKKNKKIYK